MKFYIGVTELRSTVVEVEAEDICKAIEMAEEAYNEGIICLDNLDCIDVGEYHTFDLTMEWKTILENGHPYHYPQKI